MIARLAVEGVGVVQVYQIDFQKPSLFDNL